MLLMDRQTVHGSIEINEFGGGCEGIFHGAPSSPASPQSLLIAHFESRLPIYFVKMIISRFLLNFSNDLYFSCDDGAVMNLASA